MFFLSNGRLRPHSGRYHPPQTGPPKSWPLNEIEEVTLLQEHFELAYAVPAEFVRPRSPRRTRFLSCGRGHRPPQNPGLRARARTAGPTLETRSNERSRRFRQPLSVSLSLSAGRCRGRAAQRVQPSFVQTLQGSFPGSSPNSCCVESQYATDAAQVSWQRREKCVKCLVLLAVLGLTVGWSRKKIAKQRGVQLRKSAVEGESIVLPTHKN